MRVIITGGTGLIGRALAASLVEDGHKVIVLTRSPEGESALPDGVQVAGWDARTAKGWGHLADGASGPFNLVAPEPITNAEFGKAVGRALGRPPLIPVPGFAMRTAFGDVSNVVLEGQRAIPQRLLEMGFTFRFPDAEAALEDLLR